MSQSDSFSARLYDKFFYAKPTATFDRMSFWYSAVSGHDILAVSGHFDFFDNLKQSIYIKESYWNPIEILVA